LSCRSGAFKYPGLEDPLEHGIKGNFFPEVAFDAYANGIRKGTVHSVITSGVHESWDVAPRPHSGPTFVYGLHMFKAVIIGHDNLGT
jgi:hypothetical protein